MNKYCDQDPTSGVAGSSQPGGWSTDYAKERGDFRNRRIKLAVVASLGSKFSTMGLQIVALPVGINALGVDQFGIYVTLTAFLAWISIAQLGIGPALTTQIASLGTINDSNAESRYFASSFITISCTALIICIVLAGLLPFVPVAQLLGSGFAPFQSEINRSIAILAVLLCAQLVFSPVQAARAGYQETHINNWFNMAGNTLSGLLVFLAASVSPTVSGLIVAMGSGQLVANLANALHLIHRRPYLLPRLNKFDFLSVKGLLTDGLSFSLVQVSVFLNREISLVILGRTMGPQSVTEMSVMMQLALFAHGIVLMVGQPLWPAILNARARHDLDWIRRFSRKVITLSMIYAIAVGITFAIAGHAIVREWIGSAVSVGMGLRFWTGIYFVVLTWSYMQYTVAIGMGLLSRAATVLLVESLLVTFLCVLFTKTVGSVGVPLAMCAGMLAISSWILPAINRVAINNPR